MVSVVVKYKGDFLDEFDVDADGFEEAIEEARERVRDKLKLSVVVNVDYDGQLLEEPEIEIDTDGIVDDIIENNFEFEVEDFDEEES